MKVIPQQVLNGVSFVKESLMTELLQFHEKILPTLKSFNLIENQIRCAEFLHICPWYWCSDSRTIKEIENPSKLRIWRVVTVIYLCLVGVEVAHFGYKIHIRGKDTLSYILLRTTFVSVHAAGTILMVSGHFNQRHLVHLFACVKTFKSPRLDDFDAARRNSHISIKKPHWIFSVENFVNSLVLYISLFLMIAFPLAAFLFPCQTLTPALFQVIKPRGPNDCLISAPLLAASFLIEVVLVLPAILMGGILSTIFVRSIAPVNRYLDAVRSLTMCHLPSTPKAQWRILRQYRKCTILIQIFNLSFQMFALPALKVSCCGIIISSMYTLLVADGQWPKVFYWLATLLMASVTTFILSIIELASRVLLLSNAILKAVQNWPLFRGSVIKKVVRSLQLIKVFVGPFNVLDRGRGPALIRFCLHRTLLLVVQSRTSS